MVLKLTVAERTDTGSQIVKIQIVKSEAIIKSTIAGKSRREWKVAGWRYLWQDVPAGDGPTRPVSICTEGTRHCKYFQSIRIGVEYGRS